MANLIGQGKTSEGHELKSMIFTNSEVQRGKRVNAYNCSEQPWIIWLGGFYVFRVKKYVNFFLYFVIGFNYNYCRPIGN